MNLYDATKAAELIGCAAATVRRLATEHALGRKIGPRAWVFTTNDIENLRNVLQPSGNPTMTGGTEAARKKLARKGVRAAKAARKKPRKA